MADYSKRLERMENKLDSINDLVVTNSQSLKDFIVNFNGHVTANEKLQYSCDLRMRSLEKFKYKWAGMATAVGVVVGIFAYIVPRLLLH
jgi:hypothetical protein